MSRWVLAAGLTLAAIFALLPVAASTQSIGSAAAVKPEAHGGGSLLQAGSSLYANETVNTGQAGVAELQFHDNTKLSVGPTSTVRLDKFVYDPSNKGAGKVAINATKGAYRFITGSQELEELRDQDPLRDPRRARDRAGDRHRTRQGKGESPPRRHPNDNAHGVSLNSEV